MGMALLSTALAADSTGVGAYYATMAMPGMVAVLTWPLAERCSRAAWVMWPAVFSIVWLTDGGLIYSTPNVEVRLVLACTIIWAAVAVRLVSLARPWAPRARWVGLGLFLLAIAHASLWTWRLVIACIAGNATEENTALLILFWLSISCRCSIRTVHERSSDICAC